MSRWDLLRGHIEAHDDLMIDLAEWEEDLARLQVTRAPHRMGGRVVWIASKPVEQPTLLVEQPTVRPALHAVA